MKTPPAVVCAVKSRTKRTKNRWYSAKVHVGNDTTVWTIIKQWRSFLLLRCTGLKYSTWRTKSRPISIYGHWGCLPRTQSSQLNKSQTGWSQVVRRGKQAKAPTSRGIHPHILEQNQTTNISKQTRNRNPSKQLSAPCWMPKSRIPVQGARRILQKVNECFHIKVAVPTDWELTPLLQYTKLGNNEQSQIEQPNQQQQTITNSGPGPANCSSHDRAINIPDLEQNKVSSKQQTLPEQQMQIETLQPDINSEPATSSNRQQTRHQHASNWLQMIPTQPSVMTLQFNRNIFKTNRPLSEGFWVHKEEITFETFKSDN